MVIPGEVTINTKYEFVKLASHSTATVANMQGLTVTGSTSGIVATVVNTAEATSTSAATIYVLPEIAPGSDRYQLAKASYLRVRKCYLGNI